MEQASTTPSRLRRPATGVALGIVGSLALTASVLGVSALAAGAGDGPADNPAVAEDQVSNPSASSSIILLDDLDGHINADDAGGVVVRGLGAFDDPAWAAFDSCMNSALSSFAVADEADFEGLEDAIETAEETCEAQLPEDARAELAAWEPFDDCMDAALDAIEFDAIEFDEATEREFDSAFEAAHDSCVDMLPEGALLDIEAGDALEACLVDNGLTDDFGIGSVVFVEHGDDFSAIEFGDVEGSVTISGTVGSLSVSAEGGASVVDLDAQMVIEDAAFEACEPGLAEG